MNKIMMSQLDMGRYVILLLATIFFATVHAQDKLPQDPTVRVGKLSNGLTYYIRHNGQTPHIADFYIAQRVGSILEEPRQRGLAHFLEHMAFNGTKNFPGDSLKPGIVKWCESVGIKFGQNLNAYTSVDQTVYNISSAPVAREGIIDSCLLILHDWSHDLTLSDKEIDKERGVIHEEWRTRRAGMAVQRLMEDAAPVIYKGTKYADCLPIGSMDIVDHFPYQDLRDYYHKWYRPDLQAIIVVGDIDVDQVEQKIKKTFGSIPAPVNPAKRIYYPVNDNDSMIVFSAVDKEQPTVNFSLYMKRDITPLDQRNTESYYADGYKTDLIRNILNDRLDELSKSADPPFVSAFAKDGSFFLASTKDAFNGFALCKQDRVLEGISALTGELERVRQHGFLQSEVDRAKAEQLKSVQNQYIDRDKKSNGYYVRECLMNFLQKEPVLTADFELAEVKKLNHDVTVEDLNKMARELITDKNQVVTIYGPDNNQFKMPSKKDIESTILTAQSKKYAPYVEKKLSGNLIEKFPKAGKIVSEQKDQFGYTKFVLSNGMKVFVKPTNFEADEVNMNMFGLGGKSMFPDADVPNLSYCAAAIQEGGIGSFDAISLDKMLSGKTISVAPFIGEETEGVKGSCNTKDMKTMFELTYLYMTSPRKDEKAFNSLINRQRAFLTNRNANPNVSYRDSIMAILYGDNPRMKPIERETLDRVNYDRILQIYKQCFSNAGDFNVILTGNIDLNTVKPFLCRYLASLPSNGRLDTVVDTHTAIRQANETHIFVKAQQTPSAIASIFITAKMPYTAENDMKLDILSQIMRIVYTNKVREEKGGTYGVSVSGSMQKYPYEEALMKIDFRTDPDKYKSLIPIIYDQLKKVAADGPDIEDLNKVKEYEYKTYDQAKILNSYWDYVMYNKLFNRIDVDTNYKDEIKGITPDSIRQFAAELLKQNNRIEVTMLSKQL
ncbi:M16 family metallopeptidase [Segatella cerevisiae]